MSQVSSVQVTKNSAFIAVDVQPTFMPGGGLPVPEGDQVVPAILNLYRRFPNALWCLTQDLHPKGHISLASSYKNFEPMAVLTPEIVENMDEGDLAEHALFSLEDLDSYFEKVYDQILWPDHALEGTEEAKIHPALLREMKAVYTQIKGSDPATDAYSGLSDSRGVNTDLESYLEKRMVDNLFIMGLALDFCVGETALDAQILTGANVYIIEDAARAVKCSLPEDVLYRNGVDSLSAMLEQLKEEGVEIISSKDLR
ncbi:MAG: isochorismatase family protein [Parcubacteria group bacterium]|nr:isochorismatase family protein [Parcubacteria group bacterium]